MKTGGSFFLNTILVESVHPWPGSMTAAWPASSSPRWALILLGKGGFLRLNCFFISKGLTPAQGACDNFGGVHIGYPSLSLLSTHITGHQGHGVVGYLHSAQRAAS